MTASTPSDDRSAANGGRAPRRLRVRVTFGFVASAAVPGIADGAEGMIQWGAVAFASLLVHELAHAVIGLYSKSRASIVLHALGGSTRMDPPLSTGRSILASLMGPVANLVLGLGISIVQVEGVSPSWLGLAMWLNLAWGAMNLLPWLPFDGGRALLCAVGQNRALCIVRLSSITAVLIGAAGLILYRNAAVTIVSAIAASASLFEWIARNRAEAEARLGLAAELAAATSLLAEGRSAEARAKARGVIRKARTNATERRALELLAWSFLDLGDADAASEALARVRPMRTVDPHCRAAVEAAAGRELRAAALLESARQAGRLPADGVKLLIDLHVRRNDLDQACRVAHHEVHLLGPEDTRCVIDVAFGGGSFSVATELAGTLNRITDSLDDGIAHAYGLTKLGQEQEARAVLGRLASRMHGWSPRAVTETRLRELGFAPSR